MRRRANILRDQILLEIERLCLAGLPIKLDNLRTLAAEFRKLQVAARRRAKDSGTKLS